MANQLANEIVSALRGMPAVEMSVLWYRDTSNTPYYLVYGTENENDEDWPPRFTEAVSAHNHIVRKGFVRILMGAELKCWKDIFTASKGTATKIIAIYAKK